MHYFLNVVSFDDVDAAGIVYYPRFFHWCHLAFEDLFNTRGPYKYHELIQKKRLGFPTVHVEADFKAPLFFGDQVAIALTAKNIGRSSMVTAYQFLEKNSNRDIFYGEVTTVCMDLVTKKSTPLPEELRNCFKSP